MLKNDETINSNGYGKLNWGDNIEKLQLIYPDVFEIKLQRSEARNVKLKNFCLGKIHCNRGTKTFSFEDNKLFEVTVDYEVLTLHEAGLLEYKLVNYYGKFDWIHKSNENDNSTPFGTHYGINIFNEYLRIIIIVKDIINMNRGMTHQHIHCIYTNRKLDRKFYLLPTDNTDDLDISDYPTIEL